MSLVLATVALSGTDTPATCAASAMVVAVSAKPRIRVGSFIMVTSRVGDEVFLSAGGSVPAPATAARNRSMTSCDALEAFAGGSFR
ncbi:MAG: hypothetical protein ACREYE_15930 [Gammaproteobacteria bacterium]